MEIIENRIMYIHAYVGISIFIWPAWNLAHPKNWNDAPGWRILTSMILQPTVVNAGRTVEIVVREGVITRGAFNPNLGPGHNNSNSAIRPRSSCCLIRDSRAEGLTESYNRGLDMGQWTQLCNTRHVLFIYLSTTSDHV